MIILKLKGGIGNQLFQYAFGRMKTNNPGSDFILDTTWYHGADRKFALNELNILYKSNISNRFIMKAFLAMLRPKVVMEEKGNFMKIKVQPKKHILFEGYWNECAKHFSLLKESFWNELTLKNPSGGFLKYSKKISKDSISIHVRRGDILPKTNIFLPQNKSYYENAIDNIMRNKKISNPQITVFSDDIPWCKENLEILGGIKTFIFDDSSVSDMEQLILMSKHNHNVIANSTFSWWAAVLNQNANKTVVAPTQWFKNQKFDAKAISSLVLPGWKTYK